MKYDKPFVKSSGFIPALLILILFILVPAIFQESYLRHIFILYFVYAVVASNWDLSLGYGGIFNFAHVSLFALGVYTYGILSKTLGLSPWIAIIAGGLAAVAFAVVLALPIMRLSGIYVILVTIAFSQLLFQLVISQSGITGGTMGMVALPALRIGDYSFISNGKIGYYYTALTLMVLSTVYLHLIVKSRIGRSIIALRDHKYYAVARGVSQAKLRVITLGASAFFTGTAGGFLGSYIRVASPDTFNLSTLTLILSILLLGGTATIWGSLVSAFLLTIFAEAFAGIGAWRNIIISGAIVGVLVFYPGGLWAVIQELREWSAVRLTALYSRWLKFRYQKWRHRVMNASEQMMMTSHGPIAVADTKSDKPALVLIHGNSSCKEVFFHQFAEFADHYRVLAFDLPGHGLSPNARRPDLTYDIAVYTAIAEEILKKKAIKSPVVLGWSLGGYIALELNAKGLALSGVAICGTPPLGNLPDDLDKAYQPTEHMELTSRLFFTGSESRQYARATVGPLKNETKYLQKIVRRTDGRARTFMFAKTITTDWPRQIKTLQTSQTPLAVINGGNDPFINHEYIGSIAYANLWGNRVHTLKDCGHSPFLTHPHLFNKVLKDFLAHAFQKQAS